ncbi:hypothetical protein AAIB98_002578 [Providencia rettgeri]|uniref:hypothetical protein n=4 Tax=Providencia TaxID=586 RepID=UPI001EE6A225|nr:hypothetical protein [Providencia rettgeri]EIU7558043.1 hypothetical protein [Providencia rettgeri]MCG5276294.1 hypothetical protein [Providencia rettgeri]MCG9507152.1 hypothetical protein [Providencia rettgeri]
MLGLRIKLPVTFTDSSLPTISEDKILTKGSLLLTDAAHRIMPWKSGILTNGELLPNIASDFASELTSGELEPQYYIKGKMPGFIERTSKGGLHVAPELGKNIRYVGAAVSVPKAIVDYICNNPTHNFYYSQWGRITRAAGSPAAWYPYMQIHRSFDNAVFPNGGAMSIGHTESFTTPLAANRTGYETTNLNNVGARLVSIAGKSSAMHASGVAGMKPEDYVDEQFRAVALMGAYDEQAAYYSYSLKHTLPAWIFYRAYIEDLTVSGRTWDEVNAIDKAMYEKEVISVGGRYFGDTFTAPA